MTKKTTTAALTAGFALLATPAFADRPADAGRKGQEKAAQQQAKQRGNQQAKQQKGVGFTLSGVGLTSLPVADGALTGPLTLDVTSANRHARTLLGLSRDEIAGTGTFSVGTTGDGVVVRFDGLSASDALRATDRIKLIGKVTRVRKGDTTTVRTLDIRKIVVTRAEQETEQGETQQGETQQGETQQSGS